MVSNVIKENRCSLNTGVRSLTNLSCHSQTLGIGDGGELLVPQPLYGVLVIS